MTVYAKSGSIAVSPLADQFAVVPYVVTGMGFQPKAILFAARPSASSTLASDGILSYGIATPAAQNVTTLSIANSTNPTQASNVISVAAVVRWNQPGARSRQLEGAVSTFDTDGFTINFRVPRGSSSPPSVAVQVDWTAFGGDVLVSTGTATIPETTASGVVSLTTGFLPKAFLGVFAAKTGTTATTIEPAQFSIGLAGESIAQTATTGLYAANGLSAANTFYGGASGAVCQDRNTTTGNAWQLARTITVSAYTTNGLTLAHSTRNVAWPMYVMYLILGGVSSSVSAASDSASGNKTRTTGFRPVWYSLHRADSNSTISNGWSDGVTHGSYAIYAADNTTPSSVGAAGYANRIGTYMSGATTGIAVTHVSVSDTSLTYNVASSTGSGLALVLAVGDRVSPIDGSATGTATATATLRKTEALAGTIAGTATATGEGLISGHPMVATITGTASAEATLRLSPTLSAAVSGASAWSATLSATSPLSGWAGGNSNIEFLAELLPTIPLSGTVDATSGHDAYLGPVARLAGEAVASSLATSSLSLAYALLSEYASYVSSETRAIVVVEDSVVRSSASASGLLLSHPLTGTLTAGSSATCEAVGFEHPPLSGEAGGSAVADATLAMAHPLSGEIGSSSSADLSDGFVLPIPLFPASNQAPGAVNLVRNPSLEYPVAGLTDWDSSGDVVIALDSALSWHGAVSVEAVYGGTGEVTVVTQRQLGIVAPAMFCASIMILAPAISVSLSLSATLADGTTVTGGIAEQSGLSRTYTDAGVVDEEIAITDWYMAQPGALVVESGTVDSLTLHVAATTTATVLLDAVQVQQDDGSRVATFVSGDLGAGYSWHGIEGLSVSVRQPLEV